MNDNILLVFGNKEVLANEGKAMAMLGRCYSTSPEVWSEATPDTLLGYVEIEDNVDEICSAPRLLISQRGGVFLTLPSRKLGGLRSAPVEPVDSSFPPELVVKRNIRSLPSPEIIRLAYDQEQNPLTWIRDLARGTTTVYDRWRRDQDPQPDTGKFTTHIGHRELLGFAVNDCWLLDIRTGAASLIFYSGGYYHRIEVKIPLP